MMRRIVYLFFTIMCPLLGLAQNDLPNPTIQRAHFLFAKGQEYLKKEYYAKGLEYTYEAARLYKQEGDYYHLANANVWTTELALNLTNKPDTLLPYLDEQAIRNSLHLSSLDTCKFYPLLLQNTGVIYGLLGDFPKQEKFYTKLFELGEKLGGEDGKRCLSDAYYDFAIINYNKRNWDGVIENGEKSLELSIQLMDSTNITYARGILASAYGDIGKIEEANAMLHKCLQFARNNEEALQIYGMMGENYADLGDFERSADYFKKAIGLWSSFGNGLSIKTLPSQLGYIRSLQLRKKYDKAQLEIDKVLRFYKEQRLAPNSNYEKVLIYRAGILLEQNKSGKALQAIKKTLTIFPESPDAMLVQAQIYSKIKAYDKANSAIDAALQIITGDTSYSDKKLPIIQQVVSDYGYFYDFLATKASILYLTGKENRDLNILKQALEYYQFIDNFMFEARKSLHNPLVRQRISSRLRSLYLQAVSVLYECYQLEPNPSYIEKAFLYSELTKNLLVAENLQKQNIERYPGLPKKLFKKEQQLVSNIQAQTYAIIRWQKAIAEKQPTASKNQLDSWNKRLESLLQELANDKEQLEQLIDQYRHNYPKYYALRYGKALSNLEDGTPSLLNQNEMLVEYLLGKKKGFVILRDANGYKQLLELDVPSNMDSLFQKFRTQLIEQDTAWNTTSHSLFELFLQPLLPYIRDYSLVIVPDAEQSTIPFEILLTKAQPYFPGMDYKTLPYFFKNRDIRYFFSANVALLGVKEQRQWRKNKILGFAPEFSENPINHYPMESKGVLRNIRPLHHSKRELEFIAQQFDGDYYLNTDATEGVLCENISQYRVMHFITHTGIDQSHNDASYLLLYPGDTSKYDGLVRIFELYTKKINADLVVLSTCNGGYGSLKKGEGIGSISRAIAYAGCTNIVYSLWPASSYTTPDIMEDFYQNIDSKVTSGKALNAAKRQFLENGQSIYGHPFFWGNFVYSGNEQTLDLNHPETFPKGLAILFVILILGIVLLVRRVVRLDRTL